MPQSRVRREVIDEDVGVQENGDVGGDMDEQVQPDEVLRGPLVVGLAQALQQAGGRGVHRALASGYFLGSCRNFRMWTSCTVTSPSPIMASSAASSGVMRS